jgi:hypothetical protein
MSDKLPENTQNEEVDLGQLFNAIGRLFEKFFSFIKQILLGVFKIIIYALKPIVNNFKLIAVILMVAAVIGFVLEKFNKPVYASDMLVKPYFDSKYQLANNVDYFNALISSNDYNQLSKIFELDTLDAKELISFEIEVGPETPNDILVEYDSYLKNIDSTIAKDVTFEIYIENRNILSGTTFSITASSYKKDIFTSLEKGFEKTFKNKHSEKQKNIRDRFFEIKRKTFSKQLERNDSLQKIYLEVLKEQSKEEGYKIGVEGLLPLTNEKPITREYDLFSQEVRLRDSIRDIDQQMIIESEYYDVLSSFEEMGTPQKNFMKRYSVLFPIVALAIIVFTFIFVKVFNYIKDYE